MQSPSPVGRRIGRVLVQQRLAEGGMGTVYLGLDERLRRRVALKSIRSEWRREPEVRSRFLREAQVLSQLEHPGICQIYGYEETEDSDYLVLEYIDGRSLKEVAREGLPLARQDRVAESLADALRVAHAAGVVHRDLKPDNVMITAEGQAKILDFGVARIAGEPEGDALGPRATAGDDTDPGVAPPPDPGAEAGEPSRLIQSWTRLGTVVGTLRYMSPEQARGQPSTPASDVYSLGLILCELYTGRPAYPEGTRGQELMDRVRAGGIVPPAGLSRDRRRLIERMLSPSTAGRPTATEVAQELRRIRRLPQRRWRLATLAAASLLTALGIAKYVADVRSARAQADHARAQAERLITGMIEAADEEILDRQELLARVSSEALRYYEDLPAPLRQGSEHRMARAARTRGRMLARRGDEAGALREYRRALQLGEQAVARQATAETLDSLALDLRRLGAAYDRAGEFEASLGLYERARRIHEQLAAADPTNLHWQEALALEWHEMGWPRLARGHVAAALEAFAESRRRYQGLLQRNPAHRPWRFRLAAGEKTIAELRLFRGEREALLDVRQARQALDSLAREAPDVVEYGVAVAECDEILGRALRAQGHVEGALRLLLGALARRESLAQKHPGDERWLMDLARSWLEIARTHRQRGDAAAERGALSHADALTAPVDASAHPYRQAVRAETLLEMGRTEEARPFVGRVAAKRLHLDPLLAAFTEACRRHGLLPDLVYSVRPPRAAVPPDCRGDCGAGHGPGSASARRGEAPPRY